MRRCWYAPMTPGGFHVVLADESDQMTDAAQLALLSKLDSTDPAPNTIWIFTANDTERLERRFLSRCKVLEFSSYGLAGEIASYLDKVWHAEGGNGSGPDFDSQATRQHPDLVPPPHQQRPRRRLQQPHPSPQIRRSRLPQLPNYRTRILFFCGKLPLNPEASH